MKMRFQIKAEHVGWTAYHAEYVSVLEKRVAELEAIVRQAGTICAVAREKRRQGRHHLSVYGAIGKCLIDEPWVDRFDAALQADAAKAAGGKS